MVRSDQITRAADQTLMKTHFSGSGLSTLACSQMMGSTPAHTHTHVSAAPQRSWVITHTPHTHTCGGVLQQLLELCWGQCGATDRHDDPQLLQRRLHVQLLHVAVERGRRDSLRRAVRRALHQINDHLCPAQTQESDHDQNTDLKSSVVIMQTAAALREIHPVKVTARESL